MITFRCHAEGARPRGAGAIATFQRKTDGDIEEWFVDMATIERHRCLLFHPQAVALQLLGPRGSEAGPDGLSKKMFRHHALAMLKADGFTDGRDRAPAFVHGAPIREDQTVGR